MKIDGISIAALIALMAFAIDRLVSALLFLLSYVHLLPDPDTSAGAQQIKANRTMKFVYFSLSLVFVAILLQTFPSIRILTAMGLRADVPLLDKILTGIVLLGGTERLSEWMKTNGTGDVSAASEQPIQVTGKLTLEDHRQ